MNGTRSYIRTLTPFAATAALLILMGCPPDAAQGNGNFDPPPDGGGINDPSPYQVPEGQPRVRTGNWAFTLFGDFGQVDEIDAGVRLHLDGTTSDYPAPVNTLQGPLSWSQTGDAFRMEQPADADAQVLVYEATVEYPWYLEGRLLDANNPEFEAKFIAHYVEADHEIDPDDQPDPVALP